jgi:hypothetical protein
MDIRHPLFKRQLLFKRSAASKDIYKSCITVFQKGPLMETLAEYTRIDGRQIGAVFGPITSDSLAHPNSVEGELCSRVKTHLQLTLQIDDRH